MYLNKILLTTDFSEESFEAFGLAKHEAETTKSELTLLHVSEIPMVPYGLDGFMVPSPLAKEIEQEILGGANDKLKELSEKYFAPLTVRTAALSTTSSAASTICDFASQNHIGLIITASQGKGAVKRALLGSTAERVLRHAKCPVLIVPGGRDQKSAPIGPYKHIMVTTDFSPDSELAFKYAAFESKINKSKVTIGHVMQELLPPSLMRGQGYLSNFGLETVVSSFRDAVSQKLSVYAKEHFPIADVKASIIEKEASIGGSIITFAKSQGCDLLVISTHGSGPRINVLGGVAERIVREAAFPVLVVPKSKA